MCLRLGSECRILGFLAPGAVRGFFLALLRSLVLFILRCRTGFRVFSRFSYPKYPETHMRFVEHHISM